MGRVSHTRHWKNHSLCFNQPQRFHWTWHKLQSTLRWCFIAFRAVLSCGTWCKFAILSSAAAPWWETAIKERDGCKMWPFSSLVYDTGIDIFRFFQYGFWEEFDHMYFCVYVFIQISFKLTENPAIFSCVHQKSVKSNKKFIAVEAQIFIYKI